MNYELAKRLKEAGYPFLQGEMWNCSPERFKELLIDHSPSLSQLIEACGGILLWGCKDHGYYASKQFCPTENKTLESVIEADASGSAPEEAVANLWLALNH